MKQKEKNKNSELSLIPREAIIGKIYYIRGKKVMFDRDLAELYGVETKVLNQAVKRNIKRFPDDFMFRLDKSEIEIWKSQIVTSNEKSENSLRSQSVTLKKGRGQHMKYVPHVFTEQGVAMLSSVLNSERAVQVNIQIIRTFTKLRELLMTHKELREKIELIEKQFNNKLSMHDKQIKLIFETMRLLLKDDAKPDGKIGFRVK